MPTMWMRKTSASEAMTGWPLESRGVISNEPGTLRMADVSPPPVAVHLAGNTVPGGARGCSSPASAREQTNRLVLSGRAAPPEALAAAPPPSPVAFSDGASPPAHSSANRASSRAFATVQPALASKRLLLPHVEDGFTDGSLMTTPWLALERREPTDPGLEAMPHAREGACGLLAVLFLYFCFH